MHAPRSAGPFISFDSQAVTFSCYRIIEHQSEAGTGIGAESGEENLITAVAGHIHFFCCPVRTTKVRHVQWATIRYPVARAAALHHEEVCLAGLAFVMYSNHRGSACGSRYCQIAERSV